MNYQPRKPYPEWAMRLLGWLLLAAIIGGILKRLFVG